MEPTVATDQDIVGWMLKGAAALIMFLLSLGVKDIRDRLRDAEQLCSQLKLLEQRLDRMEKDYDELRKKVN